MNQRSLIPRGREHWPRLRTGTYGQRLRPLSTSTMFPQMLPQDCNQPEESLKKSGNARQKYIASTLCLERFLSVDNPVLCHGPPHASSSGHSPLLQQCPEVQRAAPQGTNRAIEQVFQQRRAIILGYIFLAQTHEMNNRIEIRLRILHQWAHTRAATQMLKWTRGQHSVSTKLDDTLISHRMRRTLDGWAKQKQTAWSACQTHSRVHLWELGGVKASLVVQLLEWAVTLCRNPTGADLTWCSRLHKSNCCVSWNWTDPAPFGSRCQRDLDRVLPTVPHLPITDVEGKVVDTNLSKKVH